MKRVIIFGGYGVFGSHIARALAGWRIPITIAGRNLGKAQAMADSLGGDTRALAANLAQRDVCRAALEGHGVAINAAGPFQDFDAILLESCLELGCHHADIADDRRYVAMVRSYPRPLCEAKNLAAVYGCSSLPGISGALAALLRDAPGQVERARVTMFIGSKNPKGRAAVRSFLAGLGQAIAAACKAPFIGFRDREVVSLPATVWPARRLQFRVAELRSVAILARRAEKSP